MPSGAGVAASAIRNLEFNPSGPTADLPKPLLYGFIPVSLPVLHTGVSACRSLPGRGCAQQVSPDHQHQPRLLQPLHHPLLGLYTGRRNRTNPHPLKKWGAGSLMGCTAPPAQLHILYILSTRGILMVFMRNHTLHISGTWFRGEHGSAGLDSLILESFSNPNEFMILHRDPCFHYLMLRAMKPGISNSPSEIDLKDKQRKAWITVSFIA